MRLDLAAMLVVLRGWPPDLEVDFGLGIRGGSAFGELVRTYAMPVAA